MYAVSSNELGEFLKASRARLSPDAAGLHRSGHRRVAGLRREEVAVLAGVSADYYARLEQGRERNPSAPIVDAIGRALQLHADAHAHLYRLAGLGPTRTLARAAAPGPTGAPAATTAPVHPALLELLNAFPATAAYALGPSFDVLATNALAAALLAPFGATPNMARVLFTDPQARTVFVQWPAVAAATVRALRLNAGEFPADDGIRALVAELTAASPEFGALWDDHAVGGLARAFKVFVHPVAGRIELTYQTFDVRDAPGQQLLVGTPTPASAAAIARLVS